MKSRRIEFVNHNKKEVHLTGPNGGTITIHPGEKVTLPESYKKYSPQYIRFIRYVVGPVTVKEEKMRPSDRQKRVVRSTQNRKPNVGRVKSSRGPKKIVVRPNHDPRIDQSQRQPRPRRHKVVGKRVADGHRIYPDVAQKTNIPISNGIGVGILSYKRLPSLRRLIESIKRNTNLNKTTIFVSDESNDPQIAKYLHEQAHIVTIINQTHLGIAGNTNRLLKCLERFQYGILLNDDVEILAPGWDQFYVDKMANSGIQHFCYREPGVYGAPDKGVRRNVGGVPVTMVPSKPHGAIMAFTHKAFEAVGYFDEKFGKYGMEHVDWSERISRKFGLPGFYDAVGSEKYFKLHAEKSALPGRTGHLQTAREMKKSLSPDRGYVNHSPAIRVPSISFIIPFREGNRKDSLATVINNVRAQKFPNIEIILSEESWNQLATSPAYKPVKYIFNQAPRRDAHFNKSVAFNAGVREATNDCMILQDADILLPALYTQKMYSLLEDYEGCHIGDKVYYLDESSTSQTNRNGHVLPTYPCYRVVGYFEGGSLGCTKTTYNKIGGFNEGYEGYGVEDCDFFERLAGLSKFYDNRSMPFFHLEHGRTPGWENRHQANKNLQARLRKQYPSLKAYAEYCRTKLK